LKPADHDRGSGQGASRNEPWWRSWPPTFLVGVAVGLVVTVGGQWLIRALFSEEPQPRGTIERPLRAETVPGGSISSGSLTDIPDDGHVWLVARRGDRVWPVGSELGHEPSWERRIPPVLPRGEALSLALLLVGEDAGDALRSRVGRIRTLPIDVLGDFDELAVVPRFFVGVEASGSRLYAVFPQAGDAEAEAFRYENGGGLVDAQLPDDPSCHRPSRPLGLRLEWRMSGEQSGGWGVAWDQTEAGSFDASDFARLSLTVRGAAGGETFEIAIKDTANVERRVESVAAGDVSANEWQRLSVPLTAFAPVETSSLENLSIGFSQPDGSGEVCIDEIEFSGNAPAQAVPRPEESPSPEASEGAPRPRPLTLEGDNSRGDGEVMSRAHASGKATLLLGSGESAAQSFVTSGGGSFLVRVRYSNDNYGPLESVGLAIDGEAIGEFSASDTGDWDSFADADPLGPVSIDSGSHRLSISVDDGDGYGVEIDRVRLVPTS
jgi:hypothetical protein